MGSSRTPDSYYFTELPSEVNASSPYQPLPSSSNLRLDGYFVSSKSSNPPSHIMGEDIEEMTRRNSQAEFESVPLSDEEARPKPTVHYPEVLSTAKPTLPPLTTFDSDVQSSRPSSIGGTDEEDSEDYDWSGEDDLVDEEARFVKQMGVKTEQKGWSFKKFITLLFSTLIGSVFLAGILVTPAILVHFYWYNPHKTEHRRYVKDNIEAWLFWAASNILISWFLAVIIDLIPNVVWLFISAAWGHVSEHIKSRIELYDSVKDSFKPVFYAGSAYASWTIIFEHIYTLYNSQNTSTSRAGYTKRLAEVVQFFFFLILVWCVQRMLSHFIAFSFHRTAYKERIQSLETSLDVIEKLRKYRPKPPKSGNRTPILGTGLGFSSNKEHFAFLSSALRNATPFHPHHTSTADDGETGDVEEDEHHTLVALAHRKKKSKRSLPWTSTRALSDDGHRKVDSVEEVNEIPSPSPPHPILDTRPVTPSQLNPNRYPPSMKESPKGSFDLSTGDATLVHAVKAIKTAVLHDARNIRGKEDNPSLSWNVNSAHEAKRLARAIFMRMKDRRRTYLLPSDFYPAFPDHDTAEAAFRVFDKDNNGDLSRAELKTTLLKVYKERRFLSRSMRDVGEALKTLDSILRFFAGAILFIISLSVFAVNVGKSLSSMYTIGIAASFIFKNAASSSFDAIMFLFVSHPYDTGDRVFIDSDNFVVKKVGLFATEFARSDGTQTYYFNSQLFSKLITNVRRSGKTAENLTMQVAWRTPLEKLDALEKCLNDWLSTEENRWFEPSTAIALQNINMQKYLEITIGIGHNGNWQDWGLKNARKTAFHAAVQYYCRQLGIVGYEAPLPVVYANPETELYDFPQPTSEEEPFSPAAASPSTKKRFVEEAEAAELEAKNMKPTLGFIPPLATRSKHLIRARKSKGRGTILRTMGAD